MTWNHITIMMTATHAHFPRRFTLGMELSPDACIKNNNIMMMFIEYFVRITLILCKGHAVEK